MKQMKFYLHKMRTLIAFLLTFVIAFGAIPYISFASNTVANDIIGYIEYYDNDDNVLGIDIEAFRSLRYGQMSEARRNYFVLLEGNYRGGFLQQRFVELFGWHSTEDIRNNYSLMFDMPSEFVDQSILNILTAGILPLTEVDWMMREPRRLYANVK